MIRALGRSATGPDAVVLAATYDQQLQAINDHQLAFETLCRRVETRPDLFSAPDALSTLFRDVESYLSELITEFEDVRPNFSGDPLGCNLARLPRLFDLLAPGALDPFSKPFREMERALREDIRSTLTNVDMDDSTGQSLG